MPASVLLDTSDFLHVAVTVALVLVGGLTVLFSLLFLGGRVVRRSTLQVRVRTGIVAAILVIVLALLDMYLQLVAA